MVRQPRLSFPRFDERASAADVDGRGGRSDGGVATLGGAAEGEPHAEAERRPAECTVERLDAAVLLALATHHRPADHSAGHHAEEPGHDLERRAPDPRPLTRPGKL